MEQRVWQQIESIFNQALRLPLNSRSEFIEEACENDVELYKEVTSLLKQTEEDMYFLEQPVSELAIKLLGKEALSE